jgi:hypothetical protein
LKAIRRLMARFCTVSWVRTSQNSLLPRGTSAAGTVAWRGPSRRCVGSDIGRQGEQGREALRLGPRVAPRARSVRRGTLAARRRGIGDPTELAYYLAYGPKETSAEELIRVAGRRWAIENCFEQAKGEVGLDEYEVRKWEACHQHVTLSLVAHAYLAVLRSDTYHVREPGKRGDCRCPELIPLTVPEVRRLILAMAGPEEEREFRLGWSLWRRAQQAVARRCDSAKPDFSPFSEVHQKCWLGSWWIPNRRRRSTAVLPRPACLTRSTYRHRDSAHKLPSGFTNHIEIWYSAQSSSAGAQVAGAPSVAANVRGSSWGGLSCTLRPFRPAHHLTLRCRPHQESSAFLPYRPKYADPAPVVSRLIDA